MARSGNDTDGTKTDMAPQTSGPGHRGPIPTFLLILVGYLYLCCLLGVWTSMSGLTGLALGLLAETVGLSWQGRSLRKTTFRRMEASGLLLLLLCTAKPLSPWPAVSYLIPTLEFLSGLLVGLGTASQAHHSGPERTLHAGRAILLALANLSMPLMVILSLRLLGKTIPLTPLDAGTADVIGSTLALCGVGLSAASALMRLSGPRRSPLSYAYSLLLLSPGLCSLLQSWLPVSGPLLGWSCLLWAGAPVLLSSLMVQRERAGWDEALLSIAAACGTCAFLLWQRGFYGSGSVIYPLDEKQPLLVPTALVLAIVSCVSLVRLGRASATEDGATERVSTQACPKQDLQTMAHELGLSSREGDVLTGIVAGETVRETSSRLGLSMGTVSTYRSRICKKAGVKGTPALLALIARRQSEQGKEARLERRPTRRGSGPLGDVRQALAIVALSFSALPLGFVAWYPSSIEHEKPIVTIGLLVGILVGEAYGAHRRPAQGQPDGGGRRCAGALPWLMLTFQWLLVLLVESRTRALSNWGWLTCFACGLAGALAAAPDIPADADPSQRRLPLPSGMLALALAGFLAGIASSWFCVMDTRSPVLALGPVICALPLLATLLWREQKGAANLTLGVAAPFFVGVFCGTGPLDGLLPVAQNAVTYALLFVAASALATVAVTLTLRDFRAMARLRETEGAQPAEAWLRGHGLSEAECAVALRLGQGLNVSAIADELCLARSTVATHRQKTYGKLDVHSQRELIALLTSRRG